MIECVAVLVRAVRISAIVIVAGVAADFLTLVSSSGSIFHREFVEVEGGE